jgi:hypothetical protein
VKWIGSAVLQATKTEVGRKYPHSDFDSETKVVDFEPLLIFPKQKKIKTRERKKEKNARKSK